MKKQIALIVIIVISFLPTFVSAEEHLIVFAANLESTGGVHRENHRGADLYSVVFDATLKTVSNLRRLTSDGDASEWFPALSPDVKWVAYYYQKQNRNQVRLINLATGNDAEIAIDARFPAWISVSELLVSKKVESVNDIFKINLNLQTDTPEVVSEERITDRSRRPGTTMAGDPYPFPDGKRSFSIPCAAIHRRFRQPLQGERFPHYFWKGNILILHASSGLSNDPEPSGVWKPADKHHFLLHDSTANLYAIGQYTNKFRGVLELVNLIKSGAIPIDKMLTANINLGQSQLNNQFIASFQRTTLDPLLNMQNSGDIKIATYNQIVDEWKTIDDSVGYIYNTPAKTSVKSRRSDFLDFQLDQNYPNPFNLETTLFFHLAATRQVNLTIYDVLGKKVRTMVNGEMSSGNHPC